MAAVPSAFAQAICNAPFARSAKPDCTSSNNRVAISAVQSRLEGAVDCRWFRDAKVRNAGLSASSFSHVSFVDLRAEAPTVLARLNPETHQRVRPARRSLSHAAWLAVCACHDNAVDVIAAPSLWLKVDRGNI